MRTSEAAEQFDHLLVSHGIQQFSEAAVLVTRAGHPPGDIGFLEFVQAR